jgi:NAD(P)-dependent dehydrogenase (short-subunit alcohol dehydrogenase family)
MASRAGARRVLVTGAGSGIGRAVAERLARAGHHVTGTVRGAGRAHALTEGAGRASLDLRFRPLDLSLPAEADALYRELAQEGGVDVLVNNAGYGVFGALEDVAPGDAARQFDVNVLGPLRLTRGLLPSLRERRGRIIWIGSLAGRQGLAFQSHYSATKAAVAAISDALRVELRAHGVQVTCVEPGDFATGFTEARLVAGAEGSPYALAAARCLTAVEREECTADGPDRVARVIERLVGRRWMPSRVPVGRLARTTCLFLRVVPHSVGQFMARKRYGL